MGDSSSRSNSSPAAGPEAAQGGPRASLRELALIFLRLGTTAFGGPAAHIAMMEDELVRRRRWVTPERFLDLLAAVNLIPGPNSTEMAIYLGYLRAGWRGLIVAGVCFILPAMAIVMAIAWAYLHYGSLPQFAGVLYGVKPVVIAVVLQALWGLGRKAVKSRLLAVLAAAAVAACCFHVDAITVLLLAGVAAGLGRAPAPGGDIDLSRSWSCSWWPAAFWPPVTSPADWAARPRRRSDRGRSSSTSSGSARCCMGAATCCWPFCKTIWSAVFTG